MLGLGSLVEEILICRDRILDSGWELGVGIAGESVGKGEDFGVVEGVGEGGSCEFWLLLSDLLLSRMRRHGSRGPRLVRRLNWDHKH